MLLLHLWAPGLPGLQWYHNIVRIVIRAFYQLLWQLGNMLVLTRHTQTQQQQLREKAQQSLCRGSHWRDTSPSFSFSHVGQRTHAGSGKIAATPQLLLVLTAVQE